MTTTEEPTTTAGEGDHPTAWHLSGNRAPVFDEVTITDLEVTGALPPELNGRYVRNGANPQTGVSDHWFLGDGMVHGIELDSGRARAYRNRWVRTDSVADRLGEPHRPGATQPLHDASNTNVINFAGRVLSLTEGARPYELDARLDTIGRADVGASLPHGMTAHPKVDPVNGELHAFAYWWEEPYLLYHRFSSTGILVQTEAIELPTPVSMHDFAITEHHVVFLDQPAVFDLDAMARTGFPFSWQPEHGARIGLLPRHSGDGVHWIDAPLGYVFHTLNAFEHDGELLLDVPLIPSAYAGDGFEAGGARFLGLQRWTIDLDTGRLSIDVIDDTAQEFCRVADDRVGRPYRFGYTVELGERMPYERTRIFRHDVQAGTRTDHDFGPGVHPGEFVFVADPDRAGDEDGGWLLGIVHHDDSDAATLSVLDAQDVAGAPVAEVVVPRRVPFGLHGNWIPA